MSKKIKYYPITHGHIVAAWHLLYLTKNHKGITAKDATGITRKSGKLGGTVPAKQGLKICTDYGFLRFHGDQLHITELSEKSLIPKCDQEEMNTSVLRSILLYIISFHNFEWLIFYNSDPELFRENLKDNDSNWTNLLDNASLFDFDDEDVNVWWNMVLSKYERYKEGVKKAIGDVGEKLTYHSELKRVEKNGYTPPKLFVKWASRISDRFGFDVQSIRGDYFLASFKKNDTIQIEVKSTDADNLDRFRFFISKPEWNKALENLDSYYFFCWSGVDIENDTAKNGPFVIPATDLVSSIPTDNSKNFQWRECRCVIDLNKYNLLN